MKKIILLFGAISFLFPLATKAVCPVCTITVGVGVGLCRYLGISDLISGAWIGGLIVSMILWTLDWMKRKNIKFARKALVIGAGYYLIVILPLYWMGIMGQPLNKIWGIDKLLAGIAAGSIALILGVLIDMFLRQKREGKAFFPFQKVVFPVALLVIASLIFYYTC